MGEYADELNDQMWSNIGMEDKYGRELCMKHDYPIEKGHCWLCLQENKRSKLKKGEK